MRDIKIDIFYMQTKKMKQIIFSSHPNNNINIRLFMVKMDALSYQDKN